MNWATVAQEQNGVDSDKHLGDNDEKQVIFDIALKSGLNSRGGKGDDCEVLGVHRELFDPPLQLLLESIDNLVVEGWVALAVHEVEENTRLGGCEVIFASERILFKFLRHGASEDGVHVDVDKHRVKQWVALARLDLVKQLHVILVRRQVVDVVLALVDEVNRSLG